MIHAEAKRPRDTATTANKKRKHSLVTPQVPSVQSSGMEEYFIAKPLVENGDVRVRSSTTPGRIPSVPVALRRGSHISGSAPYMGSRIENIRQESTRSVGDALPSTLWDYLMLEMENQEVRGVEEYKSERLANFLRIPEKFEKAIPPYIPG